MLEKLIKKCIELRVIILFFLTVIALYGLYSYYIIPKQENPDVTVPIAVIKTTYPGASPSDVEFYVTEKIEQKVAEIEKVDSYESYSMNSASIVIVRFDLNEEQKDMFPLLRTAIDGVKSELPDMCADPEIVSDLIEKNQFIMALSSDKYAVDELSEYATTLKSELLKVSGVAAVNIEGERERRVVVEADYNKLNLYGISIETLLQLLQAQNLTIPSGALHYDTGKITVATPAIFENIADIENIVVGGAEEGLGFVRLKDVATVDFETKNNFYYQQDGRDAILLTGTFRSGVNPVNIGNAFLKRLYELKSTIPEDIYFTEVMFSPADISKSINGFVFSLLQSILLIVIVVMLGVHLRNGIVVSTAIPISILVTFIVMNLMKIEFHFISIAALIISLGILVDNAIVVSEAIQQNLNSGTERLSAIITGVEQTAMPMLTSTLTTMVTFGIIYLVPGSIGKIAGTIPTVVITALIASYIIAVFVVPILAYMFFKPEPREKAERKNLVKSFFMGMLSLALKYKAAALVLSFSSLLVAALLVLQVGVKFFPFANKPMVYVSLTSETYSMQKTEQLAKSVQQILQSKPLVTGVTSGIGKGLPSFFLTSDSPSEADNVGQLLLNLDPEEVKKYAGIEAVARELQAALDAEITGGNVLVRCLEYAMPTEAKLTFTITGKDLENINSAATILRETLSETPGTEQVRDAAVSPEFEYEVILSSEQLSTYGLVKYDVVKQINTSLMGVVASQYVRGGKEYDILLRANTKDLEQLKMLPIISSAGKMKLILSDVAQFTLKSHVPEIRRYNGKRYVNVLSGVLPSFSAANIETDVLLKTAVSLEELDVSVLPRGEAASMNDLIGNIGISGTGAVLLIYIILLLQFGSFKKPFIILTSIPLSLIGCFLGLYIFKMDIQAMAILGLVSLFGIVVNNGIILVEFMEAERAAGKTTKEACSSAVELRYRPIMLSSVTTCIGLVPLIVAADPMTAPMASVLMFGLLFSTILTMVVVPTMYSIMVRD